ncbi:MAG: AAA family ATPase [Sporichthyaceae bacterium]
MTRRLLEREGEIATLRGLVADACGGVARVALLEGPAGIGKSSLLAATADLAREAGATVATCCGGPSEQDIPFALVRQLFDPLRIRLGESGWAELTGGAAAMAAPALDLAVEPSAGADRLHGTLHGLYWLVANLAAAGPVVLLADDVQWGDPASLRWLGYLTRRVAGLRLLVVLAARPNPGAAEALLTDVLTLVSTPPIHPAPLGPAAAAQLVRATLGEGATDAFGAACHRATGGNPFLLAALTVSMRDAGVRPTDQAASAVEDFSSDEVARTLDRRLLALPSGCGPLLEALAVLGDGAGLPTIAEFAELSIEEAGKAADALRQAGVLGRAADLTFGHPVLRSAADARLRPAARAAAHRRAATLLANSGAPADQLARHLLHADPAGEPEVARTLAAAANVAVDRGAPEAALRYLRRALAEPPDPRDAPAMTFAMGLAAMSVRAADATPLLRTAVQSEPDPRLRAQRALTVAHALLLAGEWLDVIVVCRAALENPRELAPAERVALTAELAVGAAFSGQLDDARRLLDELPVDASGVGAVLAARAFIATVVNDCGQAQELLARLIADYDPERSSPSVGVAILGVATWLDQPEPALAMCNAMLSLGQATGSKNLVSPAMAIRAELNLRCGDVLGAEADGAFAMEVNQDTAIAAVRTWVTAWLVDALVERGSLEAAAGALFDPRVDPDPPAAMAAALYAGAAGRLDLARGRPAEALAWLREAGRRWAAMGIVNPLVATWRPGAVAAALALGEDEEARGLADEECALARAGGLARPIGVGLRVRAMVESGAARTATLTEAVAVLRTTPAQLELARALVDLGTALRQGGDAVAGRTPLREGLDLADRIGAVALAERARAELLAAGARPRRAATSGVGALTAQERRVAEMAAAGTTSRAIAQALFVTQRTVDTHLGHAYQKLGIRSRAQLASALADATGDRCRRTFVFTDIVASTPLVEALGDEAWGHLLRWHDATLRAAFALHGGEVVNRIGDGFFVAFDEPASAVECAIAVQSSLAAHRSSHGFAPSVRIGVHEAEATRVEGPDYQGRGVHVAARIGGAAASGEILASASTVRGLRGLATDNARAVDLKGLAEPIEVVSLAWR